MRKPAAAFVITVECGRIALSAEAALVFDRNRWASWSNRRSTLHSKLWREPYGCVYTAT